MTTRGRPPAAGAANCARPWGPAAGWGTGGVGANTERGGQERNRAYDVRIEHGRAVGANAVLGRALDASEVASKASATEVLCYGTAVVLD